MVKRLLILLCYLVFDFCLPDKQKQVKTGLPESHNKRIYVKLFNQTLGICEKIM